MSIKKEARKELRKGAQLVIIQLSKDGEDLPTDYSWLTNVKIGVDGAKKEEITQLLEKHKKCFPKQLPMRLPPERPVSHEITVEQGSAPPSRPPFRLSQPELDELRKHLKVARTSYFLNVNCLIFLHKSFYRTTRGGMEIFRNFYRQKVDFFKWPVLYATQWEKQHFPP